MLNSFKRHWVFFFFLSIGVETTVSEKYAVRRPGDGMLFFDRIGEEAKRVCGETRDLSLSFLIRLN